MLHSIPVCACGYAQVDGIYACPFAEQTKQYAVPLNIGSRQEKERTLLVKSLQVEFTNTNACREKDSLNTMSDNERNVKGASFATK